MGAGETSGNYSETVSDAELSLLRIEAHLDRMDKKIDHVDEQLHGLLRLIEEHRPLLARAAALADPGGKVRDWIRPKKAKPDAVPQDS